MLQGKAFLITGAGGALSRALIPAFHQAGARLFLSDPRPERMAERAQAVGAKTFVADLTRLEEALALARFVEEGAGHTLTPLMARVGLAFLEHWLEAR
jgi:NAD(P)-dependent dehydrogenase (short-subunit alcohol dehydrogenase family)